MAGGFIVRNGKSRRGEILDIAPSYFPENNIGLKIKFWDSEEQYIIQN